MRSSRISSGAFAAIASSCSTDVPRSPASPDITWGTAAAAAAIAVTTCAHSAASSGPADDPAVATVGSGRVSTVVIVSAATRCEHERADDQQHHEPGPLHRNLHRIRPDGSISRESRPFPARTR